MPNRKIYEHFSLSMYFQWSVVDYQKENYQNMQYVHVSQGRTRTHFNNISHTSGTAEHGFQLEVNPINSCIVLHNPPQHGSFEQLLPCSSNTTPKPISEDKENGSFPKFPVYLRTKIRQKSYIKEALHMYYLPLILRNSFSERKASRPRPPGFQSASKLQAEGPRTQLDKDTTKNVPRVTLSTVL